MMGTVAGYLADRTPLGRVASAAKLRRVLTFAAVGASGILVDGGLTAAGLSVGLWYVFANAAGYLTAVSWNFALNYHITWGRPGGSVWRMYGQYLSADIGLFAVRLGMVGALVEVGHVHPLVASLAGIVTVAGLTFYVAEEVVFDAE